MMVERQIFTISFEMSAFNRALFGDVFNTASLFHYGIWAVFDEFK